MSVAVETKTTTGRFSATIRKTATEMVRVTVDEYRGREVLDIRVWFVDAESGEVHPTRKGVTLAATRLGELVEILGRALDVVSPSGRAA